MGGNLSSIGGVDRTPHAAWANRLRYWQETREMRISLFDMARRAEPAHMYSVLSGA